MRNNDILCDYKRFIFEKVENRAHEMVDYSLLLNTLFNIPFKCYLAMDENRMEDAIDMREDFISELFDRKIDVSIVKDRYISVLEVLLALAIRMEKDILCDPMSDFDHSSDHFWVFLRNLGVEKYTNDRFLEGEVREKCEKFVRREYDRNGFGGIFPLKKCHNDVRKMEIWGQMMSYINENY